MTIISIHTAPDNVLNYLVATLNGFKDLRHNTHEFNKDLLMTYSGPRGGYNMFFSQLDYATNANSAYPIIAAENISIVTKEQRWIDTQHNALAIHGSNDHIMIGGDNHLQAAMRAHVAYHLAPVGAHGVEVPDHVLELLSYDKPKVLNEEYYNAITGSGYITGNTNIPGSKS